MTTPTTTSSDCSSCRHARAESGSSDGTLTGTCAAYTDGIPLEIFIGDEHHDELRGDESAPVVFDPLFTR
jgi:hypothetical protein